MIVFEDKALADEAVAAVEKQIHFEDNAPTTIHVEGENPVTQPHNEKMV